VYFFFPETRRRTLEDIDVIFIEAKSSLSVARLSKQMPENVAQLSILAVTKNPIHNDKILNRETTPIREDSAKARVSMMEDSVQ
jgi:hypothetical protein